MRFLFLAILALGLAGCNGGGQPAELQPAKDPNVARSSVPGPDKLPAPDFSVKTSLRMFRNGEELRVGDSIDTALRVFREEKTSYKVAEMPSGWKDRDYTCQGWDNGTLGFAAIVNDEKVALALYHEDRASEARLQEILADYDKMINLSPQAVTGSRVRYWFWEDGDHRLMICAVQIPSEGLNISISLGDSKLMDIFRMNPTLADRDRQSAEKLFQDGLQSQ
ncbi:MAG: hypothetical protein H7Y17_02330 [Chlorobia bacterium]|nr:hypothetical protein [Fimbriimonadaceae bacterium]